MNILVAMSIFNTDDVKSVFKKANLAQDNHLVFASDHPSDEELENIDIESGWDSELSKKMLDNPNSKLKWVQSWSAGVDYMPLEKLKERNILLSNTSGIHAEPIAESTIGMILGHYRDLNRAAAEQDWYELNRPLPVMNDKKVLIFGTGSIGGRIGEIAKAFHAKTIGVNHNGHPADGFDETIDMKKATTNYINDVDIIINALPLTDKTKNFFDRSFFELLKNQPLFSNIGRGPSVNTKDLINALNNQQVGFAALDVTDPEPLPSDSPLWGMSNALVTPHISGHHAGQVHQIVDIFKENLNQFKKNGQLKIKKVNLDSGY